MPAVGAVVGREAELAELAALAEEARAGRRRVALVCGDAGIGKTTVVERAVEDAADAGMRVSWGRCWEGGGAAPFWPWAQVVRTCLSLVDDDVLAGLGPLAGDLVHLAPGLPARVPGTVVTTPAQGPEGRMRVFDSVEVFLARVAGEAGLVVALDDLHAADEGSLELLRFLARSGRPGSLLFLGTYRITEVARSTVHQLSLGAVARHGPTLRLGGFGQDDVGTLLAHAGVEADDVDVRRVHDVTDGNPYLVYEAARILGRVGGQGSRGLVLPTEARALIHQRLEPVTREVHDVLQGGAVLGREFNLGLLSTLLERAPDDVLDSLAQAVALGVVQEVGLGVWAFTHSLLRESLLDELDGGERATLHWRAGEVLERLHANDPTTISQVADHFFRGAAAGLAARVVDACARAGAAATEVYAHEDAAHWYERALEALTVTGPDDERRRYDLLVLQAQTLTRGGDIKAAAEVDHQAIKSARALGSVELAAEAAVRAAPMGVSDAVVIGALDDALCDLPEEDSSLRARVLVSFARALRASSISRTVLAGISRQGLDMARRLGDPETQWWTLWQWHQNVFHDPTTLDDRFAVAEELLAIAERAGSLERVVMARQWRGADLFEAGDLDGALAEFVATVADAMALRHPFLQWVAHVALSGIAAAQGRLADGERLAEQALAIGEAFRSPEAEIAFDCELLHIRRLEGRFADAARLTERAVDRWAPTGFGCQKSLPPVRALVESGKTEEAAKLLDELLADGVVETVFSLNVPGTGLVPAPRLCCAVETAEICSQLGDRTRAEPLYELLLPYAGVHIVMGEADSLGVCDRYLGQLAGVLGRHVDAELHFREAHRLHVRMGARIWAAFGRADHATMLERRGGPGDRAEVAELLTEAQAAFRAMDIPRREERVAARLAALTGGHGALVVVLEGEYWAIRYEGTAIRVPDSAGLRYLARLVVNPGQELHALELLVGDGGSSRPAGRDPERGATAAGDAGAVLDSQAKAAYRRRVDELDRELAQAEARGDRGTAARVREEADFIRAELSGAVGLGGRDRRAASDAERARQSVTRAVRRAIERVAELDPALGDHLRASVRTGLFASYIPE